MHSTILPLVFFIAFQLLPSTSSRSESLGDIVLLRGTIRRHTNSSFSSPTSFPSELSTLEQKAISKPIGDSPLGLRSSGLHFFVLFSRVVPFCQVVSMLCLKLQIPET
ncbi:hypothetical protein MTR67_001753 [Solanum verrucosum]|uniref:Uncharacterized protein n=1 Tax=Solanum verrucosum TaxID=315347 RepID=A0AAF0PNR4_SOLVR|nr:hypothetical protein MTR67_001753 [Solanum verrucosum]